MLRPHLIPFFEAALMRTRPGARFTAKVMTALTLGVATTGVAKADGTDSAGVAGSTTKSSALKLLALGRMGALVGSMAVGLMATVGILAGSSRNGAEVPASPRSVGTHAWQSVEAPARELVRAASTKLSGRLEPADSIFDIAAVPDALIDMDFEDGIQPARFEFGVVLTGPPRDGNRYCLQGSLSPALSGTASIRPRIAFQPLQDFAYENDLTFSFDYWLGDGLSYVKVQFWNETQRRTYSAWLRRPVRGAWTHADLEIGSLRNDYRPDARMVPGDSITNLQVAGGISAQLFYLDNLKLHYRSGGPRRAAAMISAENHTRAAR
jgi:hypothetical protein